MIQFHLSDDTAAFDVLHLYYGIKAIELAMFSKNVDTLRT